MDTKVSERTVGQPTPCHRPWWPRFLAVGAALSGIATPPLPAAGVLQPNIVIVLLDDLGWNDLGCQGSPDIQTPHIDRLAASGVRLSAGYVPASVCGPSRASLMTGRPSAEFGVTGNGEARLGIPLHHPTLAELLRPLGYATHAVGKWHLGETSADQTPMARGFDSFLGFLGGASHYQPFSANGWEWNAVRDNTPTQRDDTVLGVGDLPPDTYLTDLFSDEMVAIAASAGPAPFFVYLSYNAPHAPLQAPDHYKLRNEHIADSKRRTFAAMMTAVDDGVGQLLAVLDAHNLTDTTLIILLSDNGGPTAVNTSLNTPFRGVKGDVWEGGVRVPFIVAWPGVLPAGQVSDIPISSIDILPTLVAVAGGTLAEDYPGHNFVPWLRGDALPLERSLLFWRAGGRAVRAGIHKLVSHANRGLLELYDIVANPAEDETRQVDDPPVVEALQSVIAAWETSWSQEVADVEDLDPAKIIFQTDFSAASQADGLGTAIALGASYHAGLSVSPLSAGSGVNAFRLDTLSDAGTAAPLWFAATSVGTNQSTDIQQAVALNEYFEFTVESAHGLALDALAFTMVKHGFSGFAGISLRSNLDGYASDLALVSNDTSSGVYRIVADLRLYDGFEFVRRVTFRFYLYDAYTGQNNRRLGIDDLAISGVVLPEPFAMQITRLFGPLDPRDDDTFQSPLFGTLWQLGHTWLYHELLGYLAAEPLRVGNWVYAADGYWLWLDAAISPWIWSENEGWLYYFSEYGAIPAAP
jgi:arylsulfatase A-like enzyme